jgi:hypothetical protein
MDDFVSLVQLPFCFLFTLQVLASELDLKSVSSLKSPCIYKSSEKHLQLVYAGSCTFSYFPLGYMQHQSAQLIVQ